MIQYLLLLLSRLLTIFFRRFEFSLKTADLAARQHASCTHYLRRGRGGGGGGGEGWEIHKLSTKT